MNMPSNKSRLVGLHNAFVEELIGTGYIHSSNVEEAFRAIPRHFFLPGVALEEYIVITRFPPSALMGSL